MANLYPYIDLGTWENYIPNIETYNRAPQNPQQVSNIQKSNLLAHTGTYSGKGIFLAFPNGDPWNAPNFRFQVTDLVGSSVVRPSTFITPTQGKKYRFSCWVRTPSSNPIGSNSVPICIAPYITKWGLPSSAPTGTRRPAINGTPIPTITYTQTTVLACTDNWVKVSYEFRAGIYPDRNKAAISSVSVFCADTNMRGSVLTLGLHDAIVEAGTMNVNGILYIDDIVFEEVNECDLAFSVPAYTKTNETNTGANDGTITVNATSSYPREYSLNGGAPQLSNVFGPLAPGIYSIEVTDTNPFGCSIELDNIIISEFDPGPPDPPPGENLVIDMAPLNGDNFITWFSTVGDTSFGAIECTNCCNGLANAYLKKKYVRRHTPIAAIGEVFAFYANFDTPLTDPDFPDFRLHLINQYGVAAEDVAPLQRDLFDDGVSYNMFAEVTLGGGVPVGVYRLAIVDNTDGSIKFVSNDIELMTLSKAKCDTNRLQYRSSIGVLYHWRYGALPQFLNTIRLRLYKIDQTSEGKISQYRAASSGRLRNVSMELDRLHIFEAYWFDEMALNALEVLAAHDFILINGRFFLPKALPKADRAPHRNLNKATIELYEQDFSTVNRYGKLNNVTIIGSEEPGLLIGTGVFLKIK